MCLLLPRCDAKRSGVADVSIQLATHTGDITYDGADGYGDSTGYDRAGNRRQRTVNVTPAFGDPLKTKTYEYNANDWLGSTPAVGRHAATTDNNGNTLRADLDADGDWDQAADDAYDFENRLARRTLADKSIELVYDGDGNRVKKVIRNNVGSIINVIFYLVDNLNPSGYVQVLEQFEAIAMSPPIEASRILTRRYAYGHDLLYQELNNQGEWSKYYYGYDGHGNVRFLLPCGSGNSISITDTYTYDAFGNISQQWHEGAIATVNDYLYSGEQLDQDLNLYFLRARYLNADSGRFWTMDP